MAIQSKQLIDNPFSGSDGIVTGEQFIGRENELQRLWMQVMNKKKFGNYAIMGLPRIGKSSLAWEGIMARKKELLEERTLPIWLNASTPHTVIEFYKQFGEELENCINELGEADIMENIRSEFEILQQVVDMENVKKKVQKILRYLKSVQYKIILVLDEFDGIQSYMSDKDINFLRAISYEVDKKICLVTTSRKTIEEIESSDGSVSNLAGIFKSGRLGVFDENSICKYWEWVTMEWNRKGLKFNDPPIKIYKLEAKNKVGAHPFLLNLYNSYKFESLIFNKNMDNDLELDLINQFRSMQGTLKKESMEKPCGSSKSLLDAAIQLVIGPVYNVTKEDVNKLLGYDFLKKVTVQKKEEILGYRVGLELSDGYCYICFSDYLTQIFEQQHAYNIQYWAEWSDTERALRSVVKIFVEERFKGNWEEEIEALYGGKYAKWRENFQTMKAYRESSLKRNRDASTNLVDYTQASSVFTIFISPGWNWFSGIFKGKNSYANKQEWEDKFSYLAYVRNPMAHNNEDFLSPEAVNMATQYCREITDVISYWKRKRNSV